MSLSERLYRQVGLARTYFCAFNPVADTPFENISAVVPVREHRLYQSSFLLRDYAWDVEELPFEESGNLRLDVDPKRAWADIHLLQNPIDLMYADRNMLLRVPKIGPKGADAILSARRKGRLTELSHLRALGIAAVEEAAPYILLDGRSPHQQLKLF
jgi:predicted DNA-binding helix-hairpin-helix protein